MRLRSFDHVQKPAHVKIQHLKHRQLRQFSAGVKGKTPDRGEEDWTWAAPTRIKRPEPEIPVKVGVTLTVDEVENALINAGAEEVRSLDVAASKMARRMVFATGRGPAHLRRLSDLLTRAVRRRRLVDLPAYTGAEGHGVDAGWILVDLEDVIVQLMDAETRASLKLEDHWSNIESIRQKMAMSDPEEYLESVLETNEDEGSGDHIVIINEEEVQKKGGG